MKPTVYLETTIASYLVAAPTRDIIQSAHQQATREWWTRRDRFDLYVSGPVLAEARRGEAIAAARRLDALAGLPVLSVDRGARTLANTLLRVGALPTRRVSTQSTLRSRP